MIKSNSFAGVFRKPEHERNGSAAERSGANEEKAASATISDLTSASAQMSRQQAAAVSAQHSVALGKVVTVFMRTSRYRELYLSDLEWLVMPALATGQYLIAERQDRSTGMAIPVSVVLWATVSDVVDQGLASNAGQPARLQGDEWKSGAIPWLVAAAGEPRGVAGLVKALVERQFPETGLKTLARGADGKPRVRTLHKSTSPKNRKAKSAT